MPNIFYLLLARLKDNDPEQTRYELSMQDIKSIREVRVRRDNFLRAAKGLIEKGFTLYDEEQKRFVTLGILHSADYGIGENKESLLVEFDQALYPFLYHVKRRFTTFSLSIALNLKSKYSKRFYEMLSQFKDTGILKISLLELKKRLGLIDLKTGKEEYSKFGLFVNKVLEVARKELDEHSDISFTYITEKTARKISDLAFHITYKSASKKAILSEPNLIVQKETPQKKAGIQKSTSEQKYPHPDLNSEELQPYLELTGTSKKGGFGWLRSKDNKKIAYKLVKNIPTGIVWSHIRKVEKDIKNGDLTYSIPEYFNELLNFKPQQAQSNTKEKVKNIDESSSLEIQNSVSGRYYKKMNIEFGIDLLTIGKIANQVSFDILKEAIDQISQEDLQRQKSLADKSIYVLNRLINELKLDLS